VDTETPKRTSTRAQTLARIREHGDAAGAARARPGAQLTVAAPGARKQGRLDAQSPPADPPLVARAGPFAACREADREPSS